MMDIEELVQKYYSEWARQDMTMTQALEAALTELAAGYEKRLQDANLEIDRLRLVIDKCGESELVLCQGINERDDRIQLQDARIRDLEFVIEEIIRINHYDFRGHEIAHAVIAQEKGE